jgi:hypothetical protein
LNKKGLEEQRLEKLRSLIILIGVLLAATAVSAFNISFRYVSNSSSFNMSDTCKGEIAFTPNSTKLLTVCLEEYSGTWNEVVGSCKNYSSGTYGSLSNLTTGNINSSILTVGNYYRQKITWNRIRYVSMNNSALNGMNDSGTMKTSSLNDSCSYATLPARILRDTCSGTAVLNTQLNSFYLGSTTCSGTPYRKWNISNNIW